jgi:hypothetical protein
MLFFAANPIEQNSGGFVGGVLGDKLAAEGLGENGLVEPVAEFEGFLVFGFDLGDRFEEFFDSEDNFFLFFNWW